MGISNGTLNAQEFMSIEEALEPSIVSQFTPDSSGDERERIGILCRTFKPPHLSHLLMAEQVGNQLELDEVWFMPTANPPHAPGKTTIASQHRVQMIQLAIANNPLFKVQPYEIHRG